MNYFTWIYLIGAAFYALVLTFIVCIVLIVICHWLDSRKWRRFCRACGGEKSAMTVVEAAEQVGDAAADVIAIRGIREAHLRGWIFEDLQ